MYNDNYYIAVMILTTKKFDFHYFAFEVEETSVV